MPDEHPPVEPVPAPQGELFSLYQVICESLHVLEGSDICVTLNVPKLNDWYEMRVGVPVTVPAWPEIERIMVRRIQELKPLLKEKSLAVNKKILVRVLGPCRVWLGMKLYKALYPHFDRFQYVVDGQIDI